MITILTILSIVFALGSAGAVVLALPRRGAAIGRRSCCPPPPADPYSHPIGEWPVIPFPAGSILKESWNESFDFEDDSAWRHHRAF